MEPSKTPCKFKTRRKNQRVCERDSETPFGFCKKHAISVQGRQAAKEYAAAAAAPRAPKAAFAPTAERAPAPAARWPPASPRAAARNYAPAARRYVEPGLPLAPRRRHLPPQRAAPPKRPKKRTKEIRLNEYGQWEDPETHIVFDKDTKKAYGVQDHEDGEVYELEKHHVRICEKNNWAYTLSSSDSDADDEPLAASYGRGAYDDEYDEYEDAYDPRWEAEEAEEAEESEEEDYEPPSYARGYYDDEEDDEEDDDYYTDDAR